ncbi:hypothetical protein ACS0TY_012720 [Phlomoides rotata]
MTTRERHMASLLVERSYIDLRSQVTQNGTCCNFFTSDVKYMLSDHVGAKVWTASYQSFALWVVIDHGAVPIFAKLLGSPSDDVREQDNHFSPLLLHACSPNTKKLPGTEEDLNDNQNMKDVFRLSILVMGSGRHDRWRDEERNPLFAKIVGGMGRE